MTTAAPGMTTAAPGMTTAAPGMTTAAPGMTTAAPGNEMTIVFENITPEKPKNKKIGITIHFKNGKISEPLIYGSGLIGEEAKQKYLEFSLKQSKTEIAKQVHYLIYDETVIVNNTNKQLFTDTEFEDFKQVILGKINDKFLHSDQYMETLAKETKVAIPKFEPLASNLDVNISFTSYRKSVILIVNEVFRILKKRNIHKVTKPSEFLSQIRIILDRFCEIVSNIHYK